MPKEFKLLEIRKINKSHSLKLSNLLLKGSPEYIEYFKPFDFNYSSIKSILSQAVHDYFFGIFINNKIGGFYMLRGIDQGYKIPSYGVYISESYTNLNLANLTLKHAVIFCKINKIKQIMLKVNPKNTKAKYIYETFGFKKQEIDKKGNNIYYLTIK